ncbi:MAG TPA: GNAT family N-acetyltransferase [Roseiarcus sp.]|nr:GNAT family N-acetyltransferase [Roseiarcus sp.]
MDQPLAPHATIRRLWEADRELFRGHLLRLDPESRHDRFNGGASDEFLHRYVDRCFAPGDVIFGAFVDGELRGAGELRPLEAEAARPRFFAAPGKAEAAFSIERPYRRHGLGVQLFERLMRAAAAHRIGEIDFTCASDNKAMQGLARKFSAEMHFAANQITGRLTARHATAFSIWREAVSDASDYAMAMLDAQKRALDERQAKT